MSPQQLWEEPEDIVVAPITKGISYYLSLDVDDIDINEVLEFIRDMNMELAIYKARIEALQKLEKKVKEAIRGSGEVPDVEGVIVKFGKPSVRQMVYTKKLRDMAPKDPVPEAREMMEILYPHVAEEGKDLLRMIREKLSKHIPLEDYLYEKDISPSIKIEV